MTWATGVPETRSPRISTTCRCTEPAPRCRAGSIENCGRDRPCHHSRSLRRLTARREPSAFQEVIAAVSEGTPWGKLSTSVTLRNCEFLGYLARFLLPSGSESLKIKSEAYFLQMKEPVAETRRKRT